MRRFGRLLALALLAIMLLPGLPASAKSPGEPGTVIIVLAPYITWDDITGGRMPVTADLAKRSTVGNVNIRSSVRFAPDPSQAHVVVTMSAGSPAAFDPRASAAYNAGQRLESGTAAEMYRRSAGIDPGEAAIVYLGLPRILKAAEEGTFDTVPGALGQAIYDAGGSTAAVGNSDGGHRAGDEYRSRPAALLAMDAYGLVRYGNVSSALLAERLAAPYGVETDLQAMDSALAEALRDTASDNGPALVVLDAGDPERAFNFSHDSLPEAAEAHRLRAAEKVDSVVELALKRLPDEGVLMIVPTGQVPPEVGPSGFGPVVISGPGFGEGLVASTSTHRRGLMTDLDVSATVLEILSIDRPVNMLGNPASDSPSSVSFEERVVYLDSLNDTAMAVDTVRPAIQNSFITVTVVVFLLCGVLLRPMQKAYGSWGRRLAGVFSRLIVLLLVIPLSATVMFLFVRRPDTPVMVALLLAATVLATWLIAQWLKSKFGSAVALATVGLSSAAVLMADQVFGAPLSFSGMFSYSPLLGARYYGLGNEGASVIVGGGLVGLALLSDAYADAAWSRHLRRVGPAILGALVVTISAAPFMGANVGVVAWGTVAFGILWMHLNGRRITWKTVLAMLAVIGGMVALFSLYESVAGSGAQTHLGRAWASADAGGLSELWMIVARKAETNWRVLRATNWSILMVAIMAFLGYMRWRPQGVFADTLREHPAFAVAMTAALWGSLVGYFTEDSGIVIPAIVMLYIAGSLLHIMLNGIGRETGAEQA